MDVLYAWFVGIDCGRKENRACIVDRNGSVIKEFAFANTGAGLTFLVEKLRVLSGGHLELVRVAIEIPRGPIVETLVDLGVSVFAINPKQIDRFRDRFSPAGAKDDRRDAHVLADSLRTDRRAFREIRPELPETIRLRECSRMWDELTAQRVRLVNRLREQLYRYFPQFLDLGDDPDSRWILALWELIPTPEKARSVEEPEVAGLLKKHRIRRIDAARVLEILRTEPFAVTAATREAVCEHILTLLPQVRLINEQLKQTYRRLKKLHADIPGTNADADVPSDVQILSSMPGVAVIVGSALFSEAADTIKERNYNALKALAGTAPITRSSGESRQVAMRYACVWRLRNAAYHWARVAAIRDPISKAKYADLRRKGFTHGRALRTVANRLLFVFCTLLRKGELFRSMPQAPAAA